MAFRSIFLSNYFILITFCIIFSTCDNIVITFKIISTSNYLVFITNKFIIFSFNYICISLYIVFSPFNFILFTRNYILLVGSFVITGYQLLGLRLGLWNFGILVLLFWLNIKFLCIWNLMSGMRCWFFINTCIFLCY